MNLSPLIQDALKHSMSYETYRKLMEQHTLDGTNTGAEVTPALTQFTRLNHQRMKRLDKTMKIQPEHQDFLNNTSFPLGFLVITESWCGDAAQTIPMINKVGDMAGIPLHLVLRDKNPRLMDQFLTNGNRAIAKLIVFDNNTHEVLDTWGPRPKELALLVKQEIQAHGSLSPAFKEDLQVWYNKDKGKATEADLLEVLRGVITSSSK